MRVLGSAAEEAWLWNRTRPIGTPVLVKATGVETETRTLAIERYGEAIVWLIGDPVAHSLADLEVLVLSDDVRRI